MNSFSGRWGAGSTPSCLGQALEGSDRGIGVESTKARERVVAHVGSGPHSLHI